MTQPIAIETPDNPIHVPKIEDDEPVAVIPVASVAPLDGEPDGERINTFTLAPANRGPEPATLRSNLRGSVFRNPLTSMAVAFTLGFTLARVLR